MDNKLFMHLIALQLRPTLLKLRDGLVNDLAESIRGVGDQVREEADVLGVESFGGAHCSSRTQPGWHCYLQGIPSFLSQCPPSQIPELH